MRSPAAPSNDLDVHQPRGRGAAPGAAHRRIHQVPRPSQHRQRPGREQERLGHPQAARSRPHPQPLCRAGQRLHPAGPLALSQLPPPLLLPHRRSRPQGPRAQALPRRRHHDPLREAQVVARRRRLPEARNHLRKARRGRGRDERQRSRAGARRGPHALVPVHPPSGLKVCSGPLPPPVGRRRAVDEQARGSSNTGRANSRGRCRARIAGADARRHRLRSNTDGQRCRRARIAGADARRHRLQHHRKAEARRHQARAPTTIHPAVAGRFTAPRVVTSSPSAAGSALGYRTPQTSTDGRSLRLVSCCSEPGKPDPHRSVATAAATAPSP